MNILKKLFGSGDNGSRRDSGDASGMYFYVKLHRCGDIVRVRVDMNNELSQNDESSGYWVRKLVSNGNYKCTRGEITLYFDSNRKMTNSEIQGGQLVGKDEYDSWMAQQQTAG
jgi:hypothetical protein